MAKRSKRPGGGLLGRLSRKPGRRNHAARRLGFEALEPRDLLSVAPDCIEIELIPLFDQFGRQIETVQAYQDAGDTLATFALYDTGASVVAFSPGDQLLFELLGNPIPIKVAGGAVADAIGGQITGDVSSPGVIIADGLHAVTIDSNLNVLIDFDEAAQVEGAQAFVGTPDGSPNLPTITGTPIHNRSSVHPNGVAAWVDMAAYELDFGALFPEIPEFKDIVVFMPDLRFVDPGVQLLAAADGSTTEPIRLPLELMGDDNHGDPGDMITTSPNPVHTGVDLFENAAMSSDRTFLLDTGAQLTVLSTETALHLGLDLDNPEITIDVFGAGGGTGETTTIPGFTLDALELARDDNGDGVEDGILRFREVPIFVLDVAEGVDGILGMNLFNTVDVLVYDPFDPRGPSVSMRFLNERLEEQLDADSQAAVDLLAAAFPSFGGAIGGQGLPGFHFDNGPAWQNPQNSLDVNDDGRVTRLDALLLINDINANGPRPLPKLPIRSRMRVPYPDPNGDGKLTRVDILHVINYLNVQAAAPAGETAGPAVRAAIRVAERPNSAALGGAADSLSLGLLDTAGDLLVVSAPSESSSARGEKSVQLPGDTAGRRAALAAADEVFTTLAGRPTDGRPPHRAGFIWRSESETAELDIGMQRVEPPEIGEDWTPGIGNPQL